MTAHLHVITGGPGSGKSSLINALADAGYGHMPEAGRAIIQDQVQIGGNALPWADRLAFADLMLNWEMRSWREGNTHPGPIFFDRGVPDVIGYRRLCGFSVPPHVHRAAEICRYNPRIFIAPHWPEIFTQDTERKQDMAEAEATHAAMVEAYTASGYDLISLPLAPIMDRMRFVLSHVE